MDNTSCVHELLFEIPAASDQCFNQPWRKDQQRQGKYPPHIITIPLESYNSRTSQVKGKYPPLVNSNVFLSPFFPGKKTRDKKLLMASEVSFKEFSRFIQQLRSERPGLKLPGFVYHVFMHSLTPETMWMYLRFYGTKVRHVRQKGLPQVN